MTRGVLGVVTVCTPSIRTPLVITPSTVSLGFADPRLLIQESGRSCIKGDDDGHERELARGPQALRRPQYVSSILFEKCVYSPFHDVLVQKYEGGGFIYLNSRDAVKSST